jgi:hypothetical protein
MFLHRGQHFPSYLRQHFLVVPGRIRYQVVQRLVHATHIVWGQPCGHRLDAFALARQQQTHAVVLQRRMPISMPCGFRQALNICRKASLLWAWRRETFHENNSTSNCLFVTQ